MVVNEEENCEDQGKRDTWMHMRPSSVKVAGVKSQKYSIHRHALAMRVKELFVMIDGVRTIGKVNTIPCMYTAALSLSGTE